MRCSAQRSILNAFHQSDTLRVSCLLTSLHPHTSWSNLIIAVIGLTLGRLGKRGFDPIGCASSDWNHMHPIFTIISIVVDCFALLVHILHISCAHSCFVNIPISINCHQLISVTLHPTTTSSQTKRGANTSIITDQCITYNMQWCSSSC